MTNGFHYAWYYCEGLRQSKVAKSYSNVLVHLHAQGAYLARAIDFSSFYFSHSLLFPIVFPTFLDTYNKDFAERIVRSSPKASQNKGQSVQMNVDMIFKYKNVDIKDMNIASFTALSERYHEIRSISVEDTLSRNLIFKSLDYFNSNSIQKINIEKSTCFIHDSIYISTIKMLLKIKAELLILSHINYIYYTAPLLAAEALGIPVLLLHGGFKETILIEQNSEPLYSPANIRKIIFDENISILSKQTLKQNKPIKVYDDLKSISELSGKLKALQVSGLNPVKDRMLILNHQIISEIGAHFPDSGFQNRYSNRFELLVLTLSLLKEIKGINIVLRIHPDSLRYPGEVEVVQGCINKIGIKNLMIQKPNDGDDMLIRLLEESETYPEILTLGGNATNELIAQGITAYSVGPCYLPKECKRFILNTPVDLASAIRTPSNYYCKKPTRQEIKASKLFIELFRKSIMRSQKPEEEINKFDNFYHFGRNREPNTNCDQFINNASEIKIAHHLNCIKSKSQNLKIYLNQ